MHKISEIFVKRYQQTKQLFKRTAGFNMKALNTDMNNIVHWADEPKIYSNDRPVF